MSIRISVCIPNYNHGAVLDETLASVFAANLSGVEVIVSDNASTDVSLEVIRRYAMYPAITVLEQRHVMPMARHWNTVAQAARGEWLLLLSSDDLLLPGALDILGTVVERADVDAVFFEYDLLTDDGRRHKPAFYESSALIPGSVQSRIFLKGNNFPVSACLSRRALLARQGWFDESKAFCVDWHAWLHLAAAAESVAYIREPLLLYRQHAANETHRCIAEGGALDEVIAMKEAFMSAHDITDAGIHREAMANNLKLARMYAASAGARGLETVARHYADRIEQLSAALYDPGDTADPARLGPPYPLPEGARPLELPVITGHPGQRAVER